jgi:hypothetical protein
MDFFSECGDATRLRIWQIIGKASLSVKFIHQLTNILVIGWKSENTKLLWALIWCCMDPLWDQIIQVVETSWYSWGQTYNAISIEETSNNISVVFELMMDADLHQVTLANNDVTKEPINSLYLIIRALKVFHTGMLLPPVNFHLIFMISCMIMLLLDRAPELCVFLYQVSLHSSIVVC